jgi:predicted transcriptional regulator
MSRISFTDRELDIMAVIWELGSATVRQVQERLEPDLAYTTVLTVIRNLEEKGYLRHEQEGRAHRYFPLVEQEEARASVLERLINKVFSGSPAALITQLVWTQDLSPDEAARIRRILERRLQEDDR